MCARFTVLSDTPIAAAIAGCVIPLSRNSTIWMRWRCVTGIFHRSAVFSRRTSALLHLTICCPESDGASESHLGEENSPRLPVKNLDSSRYVGGIRLELGNVCASDGTWRGSGQEAEWGRQGPKGTLGGHAQTYLQRNGL